MLEAAILLLKIVGLFVVSSVLVKVWEKVFTRNEREINRVDYLVTTLWTFTVLCVVFTFDNLYDNATLRAKLFEAQEKVILLQQENVKYGTATSQAIKQTEEATAMVGEYCSMLKEAYQLR